MKTWLRNRVLYWRVANTWLRVVLWHWRIRNRFALAWWAFRNPDNLTMLAHELACDSAETIQARNVKTGEWQHHSSRHALKCGWWLKRFLNLPVR